MIFKGVDKKTGFQMVNGASQGISINQSLRDLAKSTWKPVKYDRKLYDVPKAHQDAKIPLKEGKIVHDPYSGKKIVLTKAEAKATYGEHWTEHLAEADHIDPLKKIYTEHNSDAWLTNGDIQKAANSKENIQLISRRHNNAKRSKSNAEYVDDEAYLHDKGIHIDASGKARAREDGAKAENAVEQKLLRAKVDNIASNFHSSGKKAAEAGAIAAAASSMVNNIVAVIKGEKKPQEALQEIGKDTLKTAATSYVTGGATTVIAHTLASSKSELIQNLIKGGAPGGIVTAVMATGDVLVRYMKGEISTQECIESLGERGTNIVVTGYSATAGAAVGQALIPIPVFGAAVGAAVGSMVGTVFSGQIWQGLHQAAQEAQLAEEEYQQIRAEADAAIAYMEKEQREFEKATEKLFADRAKAINEGFDLLAKASIIGDTDVFISGLDKIAESFGKDIGIHSFDEFDAMMLDDDKPFIL